MRRLAWTFSVITVLVLVVGLIDYLIKYNWAQGDQNAFFGNPNVLLNDGQVLLIAGGFLTVGSVLMWVMALRREHGDQQHQQPGPSR